MNISQTTLILRDIKEAYPMQPMTENTIQLWTRTLADLDYETTRNVVDAWIMSEEWPPKISQIRTAVLDTQSSLPSVDEAWRMVQQRIKDTYFPEKAPRWEAPKEIQDAVKATHPDGLRGIRHSEKPDEMRRRFEKAYTELRHGQQNVAAIGPNVMKELLG
jgi:hypothetical protein